ncbi:putative Cilia- and flagella-associated protein 99 [Blattamonas nauphoetae]|uniref:Cilia- and flagella-associated protein 99 n=1 Tax=Blattamonas nauphoetae TaxID=2049346 RepID=A0ABQ9YL13_9EUKA|nr:putative Cilia- and flagella-associated protein 99 [Blattamonas nauphoetae]
MEDSGSLYNSPLFLPSYFPISLYWFGIDVLITLHSEIEIIGTSYQVAHTTAPPRKPAIIRHSFTHRNRSFARTPRDQIIQTASSLPFPVVMEGCAERGGSAQMTALHNGYLFEAHPPLLSPRSLFSSNHSQKPLQTPSRSTHIYQDLPHHHTQHPSHSSFNFSILISSQATEEADVCMCFCLGGDENREAGKTTKQILVNEVLHNLITSSASHVVLSSLCLRSRLVHGGNDTVEVETDSGVSTIGSGGGGRRVESEMKYGELVQYITELYRNFDPAVDSIEAFVEMYLDEHPVEDPEEENFVTEIVNGCTRYKRLLDPVVTSFLHHSSSSLQSDRSLFTVFSYFTLIALDSLAFPTYRSFVVSQKPHKIEPLINYLFSRDNFDSVFRPQWIKNYEESFIDGIDQSLEKYREQAQVLLDSLAKRINGTASVAKVADTTSRMTRTTQIKPFNITKPKVKKVEVPKMIKTEFKANPIPESHYQAPEEKMEKTSRTIEQKPFNLKSERRPTNKERILAEAAEREYQSLQPEHVARPAPTFANAPPVRLTQAALLREEALFRKQQQEEEQKIKEFEQGLRDTREYEEWKRGEELRMKEEERLKREERKEEMKRIEQSALQARLLKEAENQLTAAQLQAEASLALDQKRRADQRELDEKKEKAEDQAINTKIAVQQAQSGIKEKKRAIAAQIASDQSRLLEEAAQQRQKEMEERRELIKQIRALELVPQTEGQVKVFDSSKVAGHGLLDEMSLAELKERLRMETEKREAEREKKRREIVGEKVEKEDELKARIDFVTRMRERKEQEEQRTRELKAKAAAEAEKQAQAKYNSAAREMHSKISTQQNKKMQELAKMREEAEAIRQRNRLLADDGAAREERRYAQNAQGAQRSADIRVAKLNAKKVQDEDVLSNEARIRRQRVQAAQRKQLNEVNAMKKKSVADKRAEEERRRKEEDERYRKATISRGIKKLTKVENSEMDPSVAIDHLLEEEGMFGLL